MTCTDSCLLTLAQEQNDEHFCDQITTDSLRSSCLIDIAIVTEDPTLCASVESSNFCYITLAGILEDDTICDNIDSEFVVETCKKNVTEGAEFELREPTE